MEDLLINYFIQTKFSNLKCKGCNSNQFQDKFFIEALPDFFALVIERFAYDEKRKTFFKNKKNLKIDLEIDFGLFLNENAEAVNYKLISFIEHLGDTLESGHAIR